MTVGRFTPQKGYDVLLGALPQIVEAVPDARFVWIGEGPLRDEVAEGLALAGLADRVRLLDAAPDVPTLLRAADLVIAPSRFEGLSLVVLEAMSAGRAVVAARVVGLEEAVVDGATGRLVPAENPAALAAAVVDALRDPHRRAAWGAAGRARQRTAFHASLMADRMLAVYDEALAAARSGRSERLARPLSAVGDR
jgi:glycosyltransferase involved in cell wall biosynthesis